MKALTQELHFILGVHVPFQNYLDHIHISRSSDQGLGHRKQKEYIGVTKYMHLWVVLLRLKGDLVCVQCAEIQNINVHPNGDGQQSLV